MTPIIHTSHHTTGEACDITRAGEGDRETPEHKAWRARQICFHFTMLLLSAERIDVAQAAELLQAADIRIARCEIERQAQREYAQEWG